MNNLSAVCIMQMQKGDISQVDIGEIVILEPRKAQKMVDDDLGWKKMICYSFDEIQLPHVTDV